MSNGHKDIPVTGDGGGQGGRIVYRSWPLSIPVGSMLSCRKESPVLAAAIVVIEKTMAKKGIETFKRYGNLIVTEREWVGAFHEGDVPGEP